MAAVYRHTQSVSIAICRLDVMFRRTGTSRQSRLHCCAQNAAQFSSDLYFQFLGRAIMGLPTRPLGSSGFQITTVGFGAWAIGGGGWAFSWGPQDDAVSIATMRHALDLGINWIDTAAVYGLGHSEEVVGNLLRELPSSHRPFVFT